MKISLSQKFRYWLENFMARGGFSIFISLVILFIVSLIFTGLIRLIIFAINPEADVLTNIFEHLWRVFLELTDPGTLIEEQTFVYKITGTITIFTGLVIFSILIAFITTQVEQTMYNFKKGKSKVIEEGHTLILGWNEQVLDIIRELIIANISEKYSSIVILAQHDKEEMDDYISKNITEANQFL